MTLIELQEVLGERINILVDENLSDGERKQEAELSKTVSSLAKQMINNADIVLRADRLFAEGKGEKAKIKKMVGE
ncbi:MAG: hypothetical protein GX366_05195 [Epulopiscium sp.]|nr:hypothetical protein [Candidatus Epulonipiscium sp.]